MARPEGSAVNRRKSAGNTAIGRSRPQSERDWPEAEAFYPCWGMMGSPVSSTGGFTTGTSFLT